MEAAREAVLAVAPQASEAPYASKRPSSPSTMWKLTRFGDARGHVVGIGTFHRHATLFFFRGVELEDPDRILEGGGKQFRSVTLRSPEDARRPQVTRLLKQAFQRGG
ncbi:MAG TPA: DUF1801 domain-containing protein [Candidatus Dormibacteraeota bacterium]